MPPDIFSPEFAQDPYAAYRVMRQEHPLFFHEASGSYVISRHRDVALAFKDARFSTRNYAWQLEPIHGRTLMQKEGRELAAHRSLVSSFLRGRELHEKTLPQIQRIAAELISTFQEHGEVELIADFSNRFPVYVIVDMLGFPREDRARCHGWHKAILDFVANFKKDPEVSRRGLQARDELWAFVYPLIKLRREQPTHDLLSTLCNGEIDGWRLLDSEIVGFCGSLLGAGGSTTDKALASLLSNLVQHPQQLARVRDDRSLIERAFAETLRYSPPLHVILRVTTQPVEVSGGTIPADATVTCLIGAANRDESQFDRPDSFDIFRPDLNADRAFSGAAEHLAFGLGRHFCIGATLARLEVQVAVNMLLDALPELRFADGKVPAEVGLFSRAPGKLRLAFSPRRPA